MPFFKIIIGQALKEKRYYGDVSASKGLVWYLAPPRFELVPCHPKHPACFGRLLSIGCGSTVTV